ncbi:MAG: SDR family oxidoreductase [Clostridiales bacterium]|nr:SDR family oxidoreductase [Clostridiales bacterium]
MMKATLITGATGGLGKEFCKLFAKDKNDLILVATNEERLKTLKEELEREYCVCVDYVTADLSKKSEIEKVFSYTEEKGYFVNNLVNNAGFGDRTDFKDMNVDLQLKTIDVNCSALFYFTRVYIEKMLENNEGHIINVGSIAGFVPGPYMCTYHATKAFVLNFGESVCHEIRKTKVKLLTLCPGPFESGFVGRAGNDWTFKKIKPVSAKKVAEYGYKKSLQGKRVAVVGFKNKLTVFAPRFFSRKFVASASAKTLKKGD